MSSVNVLLSVYVSKVIFDKNVAFFIPEIISKSVIKFV